jgi:SNF2 family DNA or RNA helicase
MTTSYTCKATVEGDRIVTWSDGPVFEGVVLRCKETPGGRFRKADKAWGYPLSVETCHALREAWGEGLEISHELAAWYRENAVLRAAQTTLAAATDATLVRLPATAPILAAALRPDQRVGVAWVAGGYRNAGLVADEPGSGKTLEIIGGIIEADVQGQVLVACPRLSVKTVWFNELRRWAPDERVYIMRGTRAKRQRVLDRYLEDPAPRKWLITVMESLRTKDTEDENEKTIKGAEYPGLFQNRWGAVVVDESHKAFGSLTVVKGTLHGKGLKRLSTERRYACTGTPFGKGGRLQGFFGTLHWLWPDEFTSFWRWAETYFLVEEEEFYLRGGGGQKKTAKRVGALKEGNEEEFLASLGPRILRRTKEETMPWLPKKQYREVLCEMTPAQRKQYVAMVDDGEFQAGEGMVSVDGVLAAITRAKQVANGALTRDAEGKVHFDPKESCKIDNLLQLLENRGILDDSGHMKVLVTSQFNELLYAIEQRLEAFGMMYHLLTGKTSDTMREKMIEDFQNPNGPRVFLLNSKAGGVSVTLDAADEVHMLDELWDPGDNTQIEDRIHRASRAEGRVAATIVQYRTEGTIDTNIGADVEARREAQHAVLDGRRGMAYVREVVRYQPNQEEE